MLAYLIRALVIIPATVLAARYFVRCVTEHRWPKR